MREKNFYIKCWLWIGIVLIVAMVIIGGITRLTGSGLSIVEWKVISGTLPPLTATQWQEAFDHYKQFPEYQKLNYGMDISQFKSIYFWEYSHRLLGRFIGIVFILPFLFFYLKKCLPKKLIARLLLIFLLGALQGTVGWYMVKSGLVDVPHVSHFRLAIHQGIAVLLIGIILWTILSINPHVKVDFAKTRLRNSLLFVCLALLSLQIILGALVAGLKAGFTYTNYPFMGDSFLPTSNLILSKPLWYNGPVLQFIHRWLALIVLLLAIAIVQMTRQVSNVYYHSWVFSVMVILQVGLGIATLMLGVPIFFGVAHQLLAIFLFMMLIKIIHVFNVHSHYSNIR